MTPKANAASGPMLSGPASALLVREALQLCATALAGSGIEDASLEAEVLLREVLGLDRAHLYLRMEDPLPGGASTAFDELLKRRCSREPLAYIVGHVEFYGIDLRVDHRVLIPRPETELLVDCALEWAGRSSEPERQRCRIADVGTGSGAVAIALALNLPSAVVCATDISAGALEVARRNCRRHGMADRVSLVQGDLLSPLSGPVDLVLANLPYVKSGDIPGLAPEVRCFEPVSALDGGEDGLSVIRRLLSSAADSLSDGGAVMLEVGQGQGESAVRAARGAFPGAAIRLVRDFGGVDRVLCVETADP